MSVTLEVHVMFRMYFMDVGVRFQGCRLDDADSMLRVGLCRLDHACLYAASRIMVGLGLHHLGTWHVCTCVRSYNDLASHLHTSLRGWRHLPGPRQAAGIGTPAREHPGLMRSRCCHLIKLKGVVSLAEHFRIYYQNDAFWPFPEIEKWTIAAIEY